MSYKLFDKDGNVRIRNGKEVLAVDIPTIVAARSIVDPDKRIVSVISSADTQDRDGDRILQEGIDHGIHLKTRSVLYAHDYGSLPVARFQGYEIKERKVNGRAIKVTEETHQFNPPGAYEVSDAAWKLVEFGSLNATSIGFIPIVMTRANSDEERENLGLGMWGILFEKIEKLETSWVPVPSNRDAIREAFGKGVINRTDARALFPASWHKVNAPRHWVVGCDFLNDPQLVTEDIESVIGDRLVPLLDDLQVALQNLKGILSEAER